MKIAILTSGILPVPAVQGGAVENLIDFYLDYNNKHKLHDITVFSVYNENVKKHPALSSDVNHYVYIDTNSIWAKINKFVRKVLKNADNMYHHSIEYYLDETVKKIANNSFDIIILENRPAYALKMTECRCKKIVYHLHNDILNSDTNKSLDIYNAANKIICVSDYISNRVQHTIAPTENKTITIYNGIDVDYFSNKRHNISRSELGFESDDFIVVFSGRIIKDKGIKELIEAIIRIKSHTRIKLLVIGSSFLGNYSSASPFLDSLKDKAKELDKRIVFTGYINYDEVPSYLHIADIAVIPSIWHEPFGLTCLEAIASGLPLITTNVGGIPEVVDNECAEIVDVNDNIVDNLAERILYLYNNPERRQEMSIAARKRARMFTSDSYAQNFFKALEL